MATQWILPAPAKLNLFLHITGRRPNGYHNLETLFQLLDWGDSLGFENADQISLTQKPSADFPEEQNLVFKAAKLLANHTGCKQGIHIHLNKRIPTGAGLGGGSSDAATTLLALNKIWELGLSISELSGLALKLGADVPVFVEGQTSFAQGIGEKLEPLEMPNHWFLVLTPNAHISTANIFSHPELKRDSTTLFAQESSPLLTRDMSPIKMCALAVQGGQNDCQTVVEKLHPEVAKVRKTLEKYAPARMSGTGSSLFAQFEHREEAEQVLAKLAKEDLNDSSVFIARGANRSPAHQTVSRLWGD